MYELYILWISSKEGSDIEWYRIIVCNGGLENENNVINSSRSEVSNLAEFAIVIESEGDDVEGGNKNSCRSDSDEGLWSGQLHVPDPGLQVGSRACSICNNNNQLIIHIF